MKHKLLPILIFIGGFFPINIFAQAEIVGGENANIEDYPYNAALINSGGWFGGGFCGASIINEYWILTAAHCVDNSSANGTAVRVGNDASYAQGGVTYDALEIISHPNFNANTLNNDIALIRVDGPISFDNFTQPVVLMCDTQVELGVEEPGEMSWVTGWGNTEGTTSSSQLQVVGVPITTVSNYGTNQIDPDMIMAGYPDGGYDSCQGDSGGPLVVLAADGETYLQAGVVSWGNGCAEAGYPGVYTRLSYFIDWICENTNGAVCPNQSEFCNGDAIFGCTDSLASNYNPEATINNGSCEYPCDDTVSLSLQLDCYGEEISWEILNESGATVASVSGGTYPGGSTQDDMQPGGSVQEEEICLSAGCYTFVITDSWGDGLDPGDETSCVEQGWTWTGLIPFSMINTEGELLFQENDPAFGDCESGTENGPCSSSYTFCVTAPDPIYGCTDPNANNYDSSANTNDGSCQYLGCTDVAYLEYNPDANIDDGSCITLIVEGCTDPDAENYNASANTDDNSCEYIEGCTDPDANNYNPDAVINDGSCLYPYVWAPCNDQIWFEDFENYNLSDIVPQSGWLLWEGTTTDAEIISQGFYDSSQSILIDEEDDIVHEFLGSQGYFNGGSGELIFYVMIPSTDNSGGYFNILHNYNDTDSNWAYEVFFASNESETMSYVAADVNVEFNTIYDKWIEVRNVIDIDNDVVELYYDGNLVHSWTWSDGSAEQSNVLGALNLYAGCAGSNCSSNASFDNIELCGNFNVNNTNLIESNSLDWFAYPNPNNGTFELMMNQNLQNVNVEIRDLLGKIIYSSFISDYNMNTKHEIQLNQTKGTYILHLSTDDLNKEKMIIIQ